MGTSPQFAAVINHGVVAVSATANAAAAGGTPTAASNATILTAGASGTKIEEVVFVGTGTTLAGTLQLFTVKAGVFTLFDNALVTVVAPSNTLAPFRLVVPYPNLELVTGETLQICSTVASQLIMAHAFGGDL